MKPHECRKVEIRSVLVCPRSMDPCMNTCKNGAPSSKKNWLGENRTEVTQASSSGSRERNNHVLIFANEANDGLAISRGGQEDRRYGVYF